MAEHQRDVNVMRHSYRELSDLEQERMLMIKDMGREFYNRCSQMGQSEELAMAKVKIQEAVMWATKHITR